MVSAPASLSGTGGARTASRCLRRLQRCAERRGCLRPAIMARRDHVLGGRAPGLRRAVWNWPCRYVAAASFRDGAFHVVGLSDALVPEKPRAADRCCAGEQIIGE